MPMIDLGRKPEKGEISPPSGGKQAEIYYPSFYCNEDLGLTEEDAGKIKFAMVKLKIKEVGKKVDENKTSHTNSLDEISFVNDFII